MPPNAEALDVPTGSDTLDPAQEVDSLFRCWCTFTGDDAKPRQSDQWPAERVLSGLGLFDAGEPLNSARLVGGNIMIRVRESLWSALLKQMEASEGQRIVAEQRSADNNPAGRLKEISGLDAGRLAATLGVSRTAYQHWLAGTIPRGDRLERLLVVLSLVEEVAELRGSAHIWLLTPVEAGGPTPLTLLEEKKYEAFRGFLHRVPIEERLMRKRLVRRGPQPPPGEAWRKSLEAITTTAWDEDDEPEHLS